MMTKSSPGRFVIFSGFWGDTAPGALPEICADDFIACADGGYEICVSAGHKPDVVIGDFDSISADHISEIDKLGIEKIVYPCEKDDTDTMLCARHGLALGFGRFLIVGGAGGDLGHTLANLQVLSFLTDMGCDAEIVTAKNRILMADGGTGPARDGTELARGGAGLEYCKIGLECGGVEPAPNGTKPAKPLSFTGRPGGKFSVFSYAERSTGVYVQNVKYELAGAELTRSCPLGFGNEYINTEPVSVSVQSGRLLVILDR